MNDFLRRENCTEIGFIKKTQGIHGELLINLDEGFELVFEQIAFLFFEIDGLPVPFPIEEYEIRNSNSAVVKFEYINSKEKAQEYVGYKVLISSNDLEIDEAGFNAFLLKGFTVYDVTKGKIGTIDQVDDYGGNLVLTVSYKKGSVLLPLNEDLVCDFDKEKKTIEMDLPQGLFSLTD